MKKKLNKSQKGITKCRARNLPLYNFIKKNKTTYVFDRLHHPNSFSEINDFLRSIPADECFAVGVSAGVNGSVKIVPGHKNVLFTGKYLDIIVEKFHLDKDVLLSSRKVQTITLESNYKKSRERREHKEFLREYGHTPDGLRYADSKRDGKWVKNNREVLAKKSTIYERYFFEHLPLGIKKKIVRQCPVMVNHHKYFLDMYYEPKKIAIEIDGGYHNNVEQQAKDRQRDADLLSIGVKTIRISNADSTNAKVIADTIAELKA